MNFTGERKDTQAVLQLRCSAGWTSGIHEQWIYLSAVNIFLSITAVLGNTLILVALRKVSSLHPPSKLLIRCLATTDLCVGLITEPLSVVYWLSLTHEQWKLCRYAYASFFIIGYTLCSVSLLTACAISVDRLLALLLGLRYRQVVTLRRTYVIVVIFGVMSAIFSIFFLLNPLIPSWYGYVIIPLCLVTSIASYTKIFLKLRHRQIQVQGHDQQEQPSQINPLNIERYRKGVSSALWVQCTLVACYLPYGIATALVYDSKSSPSSIFVLYVATTLVYLNSSLNPILYCWKISEVKQAVKETIREAFAVNRVSSVIAELYMYFSF
ncbi:adenosine receptor A3-like [Orbicella faveolata]|uniref:adenosine receptor A3-like n=1 Tax=Orbicella faveolata TaxID=48498 RepID=UPI0009E2AF8A|nr:adenosine receptor A3-like [Orbicella faveolata]